MDIRKLAWAAIALLCGTGIIAYIVLHPEFVAEAGEISPKAWAGLLVGFSIAIALTIRRWLQDRKKRMG